ncbi:MAG: copper resistance CopC family protein [Acidimicrobiales bacterium]
MPTSPRHVLRIVATVVVILGGVLVGPAASSPAGAHTEVLRASPSPGEEVAGSVGVVEFTFLDPVQPEVTIAISGGLGEPVAGLGPVEVSDDGRIATVSFPELTDSGEYVVEYRFTADDGDTQRETYRFSIVAAQAGDEAGGGRLGATLGGMAVAVVVAAGLVVALRRRRRPDHGTTGALKHP